jgi:glycosyltransferase involved in cell wall biosynthesis
MRILYILPFVPCPVKVRSYNLVPRLAKHHDIDLVCLTRRAEDDISLRELEPYCASVRTAKYKVGSSFVHSLMSVPTPKPMRIAWVQSAAMNRQVEEAIQSARPDVIYVERWRALQYVPKLCGIPVVCDPTDSMTLYNRRLSLSGSIWTRPLAWFEYEKFRKFEAAAASEVAATTFCSRIDIEALRREAPSVRIVQIPNGVSLQTFHPKAVGEERAGRIVMTGNFGYGPNRQAVTFFLLRVFPLVRASVSGAHLIVVGRDASRYMQSKHPNAKSVAVYDSVPDVQPYLASATVAIAPILVGAGVSNKIMEASAVGTSVVATSIACGDLPVNDGEHLFVADDAQRFADRVIQLLTNDKTRGRLIAAAQQLARTRYDWDRVSLQMEELLFDVVGSCAVRQESVRPSMT